MATNYRDLNGDGGKDVRSKKPTEEKHSNSIRDFTRHKHQGMATSGPIDEPVVRKKTFSTSINQHHGINQYPVINQFHPHTEQHKYSTSEQVQYLISQNFELLQEVREIKGFAGLINSINSKVEYLINTCNQLKESTDVMAEDLSRLNRIQFDDEEVQDEEEDVEDEEEEVEDEEEKEEKDAAEISDTERESENQQFRRPTNVEHSESEPEHASNAATNQTLFRQHQYTIEDQPIPEIVEPRAPVQHPEQVYPKPAMPKRIPNESVNDGDESFESRQQSKDDQGTEEPQYSFKPDPSPTVETTRPIPRQFERELYKGNDVQKETGYQSEPLKITDTISESMETPAPPDFKLKDPVKKDKKRIDPINLQSLRKYKCKNTDKSIDNRVQYIESCETESETENEHQPLIRPVHMPEEYPEDIEDIKPKEDKFLEELALTENFKARDCLDPKSNGADTVICIDTSASMEGEPFRQSVEFINEFVDYVENWATEYSIEENIAIVHFGREARILQQLTNDYNKVRDAIENLSVGGPSPMMTGLVIAMSALFNRGGPVTVFDRQINPRVILLSDGNATDHRMFDGPDIIHPNGLQWNMIKDKLEDFAERVKLENRHIVTVPVGNNQCMDILKPLAEITDGHVSSLNRVKQLSRSFFVEVMISKTRNEVTNEGIQNKRQEIAALARGCANGEELTEEEMNEVISKVIEEKKEEIEIQQLREKLQNEIDEESEMEVGLRVRRGSSWEWADQDGFGAGTVIGHKSRGYVRVKWDCGNVGRYRHGAQNAYDLTIVDEPRLLPSDLLISEGVYVKRGKDWEWDEQDGGDGCIGCVYKCDDEGIVHVRWESGIRGNYRFGAYGKMDLEVMNPQEYGSIKIQRERDNENAKARHRSGESGNYSGSHLQTDGPGEDSDEKQLDESGSFCSNVPTESRRSNSISNTEGRHTVSNQSETSRKDIPAVPPVVWQYQKDGDWIDYAETDCEKIEKLYSTKKQGTLIVKLDGTTYRVTPHKQKQRNPNTGDEQSVRRLDP